jgi:type IV pilus assembly protein PilP
MRTLTIRPRPPRALRWIVAGGTIALLSACGGGTGEGMEDLEKYVKEIKGREGGSIEPIPEMETFETYSYPDDPGRDPFTTLSFAEPRDEKEQQTREGDGPSPDKNRPTEPLEEFALDALNYVGTLQRDGQLWALIRDPSGTVHRVQTGDYMGTNYGEIQSISPRTIELRELVKDQRGGWRKRQTSLALDDGATGSGS